LARAAALRYPSRHFPRNVMKPTILRASFLLIAVTAGLTAQDSPAADKVHAPASQQMLVGVVDFSKIFQAYPKAQEEMKRVQEQKDAFQLKLDEDQKKIEDMRVTRDMHTKGSLKYKLADLDWQAAIQSLQAKKQLFTEELRQQRQEYLVGWFTDAQRAIRQIAQERNLTLVVRSHTDFLDAGDEERARMCELRTVWYAKDEIDITEAVIKLLPLLPKEPKPPAAKDANGAKPGDGKSEVKSDGKPDGKPDGKAPGKPNDPK
jgi:Skp family chaperone for outer membrane proteins